MKTVLITGANSGIGKSLAFLYSNYKLILIVRKENDVKALLEELESKTKNQNIQILACDLSLQSEIHKCCERIKSSFDTIDILINNAGVYTESRTETSENVELNIAVNLIAPFLLTQNLLPLLENGEKPKVINISSIGEKYGKPDFDDIMSNQNYSGNRVYNNSKLLLTMMSVKCSELYANKGIQINCIHPGATMTNLVSKGDISKMPFLLRVVFKVVKGFRQNPDNSAMKIYDTIQKVEDSGITGQFFSNGKQIQSSEQSRDKNLINKTWDLCLKLTRKDNE